LRVFGGNAEVGGVGGCSEGLRVFGGNAEVGGVGGCSEGDPVFLDRVAGAGLFPQGSQAGFVTPQPNPTKSSINIPTLYFMTSRIMIKT